MAYYQQTLMSAIAGGTSHSVITIVNGAIADSFINKAVTYDGQPSDLANPKVKLAGNNDIILGSIVGVSYGKLQIAVDGWDIKFLNHDTTDLAPGTRILGAARDGDANALGYVQGAPAWPGTYAAATANNIAKARGAVLYGTTTAIGGIIRVTMKFGG